MDPYTPEEIRRRRDALQARLVCWYPDRDGFDRAVYELVRNTIVLCPGALDPISIKNQVLKVRVEKGMKLKLWERDGVVLGWSYLPEALKPELAETSLQIPIENINPWHWYLPLLEAS